jgi:hypothetical protein
MHWKALACLSTRFQDPDPLVVLRTGATPRMPFAMLQANYRYGNSNICSPIQSPQTRNAAHCQCAAMEAHFPCSRGFYE